MVYGFESTYRVEADSEGERAFLRDSFGSHSGKRLLPEAPRRASKPRKRRLLHWSGTGQVRRAGTPRLSCPETASLDAPLCPEVTRMSLSGVLQPTSDRISNRSSPRMRSGNAPEPWLPKMPTPNRDRHGNTDIAGVSRPNPVMKSRTERSSIARKEPRSSMSRGPGYYNTTRPHSALE